MLAIERLMLVAVFVRCMRGLMLVVKYSLLGFKVGSQMQGL